VNASAPPKPPRFSLASRSLQKLQHAAVVLAAVDLLLLITLAWPDLLGQTAQRLVAACSAMITLELLRRLALLVQQLRRAQESNDYSRLRLGEIVDALPAGIMLFDAADRLELCSSDFRQLYGAMADKLQPGASFEVLLRLAVTCGQVPEAAGREETWMSERMAAHRSPQGPMRRQLPDGSWRRIGEQRLTDGGLLAHSVDVTEMVMNERALEGARREAEQARRQLQEAINVLPDAFALFDRDDRLLVFNQRYLQLYECSAAAIVLGASFESILRLGLAEGQYPQAVGREDAWLAARLGSHRQPSGSILQELPGNRWLRVGERMTQDDGIAGVFTEVTELVQREQALQKVNAQLDKLNGELAELSDTDALTGLANRRHFERRLAEEHARAMRQGLPLALVLLDVDHFKAYNDHHGHPAGDACLRRVAGLLREQARRPGELAARWGGEEFVLLLPHTLANDALALARQCMDRLAAEALMHGYSPVAPKVTLSAGVSAMSAETQQDSPAVLVAMADAALYEAKRQGRARALLAPPAALRREVQCWQPPG
jgi:diguanylate cyclase (GGDEF)-like protein